MKMFDKVKEAENLIKSIKSKKQDVWVEVERVLRALDSLKYELDKNKN